MRSALLSTCDIIIERYRYLARAVVLCCYYLLPSAGAIVAKVMSEHRTKADCMIRISLFDVVSVR